MSGRKPFLFRVFPAAFLFLLACGLSDSVISGLEKADCEGRGGVWRSEVHADGRIEEGCDFSESAEKHSTETAAAAASAQNGPGESGLESCDASADVEIVVPDLGWDQNECACSYHIEANNRNAGKEIIVFSHMIVSLEDNHDEFWSIFPDEPVKPGGKIVDGGEGWVILRLGGLYSTCKLIDGELTYPEYFHTDKIGAVYADPGCRWIDDPAEYEAIAKDVPNYCHPA
jgi:hypothetical protein